METIKVTFSAVATVEHEAELPMVCPGCGHDFASDEDADGIVMHGYIGESQWCTIVGDDLDYGGAGLETDTSGATNITTGYACRFCDHVLAGDVA